jgi:chaperone modulatory protein CbpM
MQTEHLIPANDFFESHHVEISFIRSLQESGLVELVTVQEQKYLHERQLLQLEKIIRLREMDINLEGIETITHLLEQMNAMKQEIADLKNKLRFYDE